MAFTASDVKALREKTGVGRSYQEGKQNCCRGRSYGLHR